MNEQILQFLKELRQNNNRDWFHANKERYDLLHQAFLDEVQDLINRIALFDKEVIGIEAKDCYFRIYRDIRFSPDKTPYKTHFGAYIAAYGGKNSQRGGYYLHLEPEHCLLAGGIWCPKTPLVKKIRQDIYDHVEEFEAIVEKPAFKKIFPSLDGDVLKRVPYGFSADFKYEEVLRHKDFSISIVKPDSFFTAPDWLEQTAACFKIMLPFNRFLNYTVDEFEGRIEI